MSIGPEWGNAHIDVHADTSPLRREIRAAAMTAGKQFGSDFGDEAESSLGREMTALGRSMEQRLGPAWRKAGVSGGANFSKAFGDAVKSRLSRFDDDIVDAAIGGDWSRVAERFGPLEEAIEGVRRKFADMAETSNLTREDLDHLNSSFDDWVESVKQSNLDDEFDRMRVAADRLNQEFDKTTTAKSREEYDGLRREAKALHFEITKMLKVHDDEDRALQRTRDAAHEVARAFNVAEDRVRNFSRNFSLIGRLRGSRNNFLNIIGLFGQGIERFGDSAEKVFLNGGLQSAIKGFFDNFRGVGSAFKDSGIQGGLIEFNNSLKESMKGLTGGAGGKGGWTAALSAVLDILFQIAQAVAAVVLVIGSLNIIAPALSGLAGIVVALAGSLSYAVAGFLLPLGPMLLAAAGGIGALAVAFTDAEDDLKKFAKPFKDFIKEIRKPVQDALFKTLARDIDRFKSVLNNFVGPLLIESAGALSKVFEYMAIAFNRPEVQNTLAILGETLPDILLGMGRALTDFLTGLLGFFAPISIYVETIAGTIADIATEFSNWANSAEGQTAISEFFSGAATSAQILWDLILNVGGALGTLFAQGKETGDGFLGKISEIIAEFAVWADSEEGRTKISGWMQFASDLAGALWRAIETVGTYIGKLDTPQNRQALLDLIDGFTAILDAVGKIALAVAPLAPAFSFFFRFVGAMAESFADIITRISSAIQGLIGGLGRITVPSALRTVADLVNRITGGGVSVPGMASGGILTGPRRILAGEDGPEAIVPLDRDLNRVDPAVRWLSAIAQGKGGRMGAQGSGSGGRSIVVAEGAFQVITPTSDPVQVTHMVLDGLISQIA